MALEGKRLRDHANGERTKLQRDLGDNRSRAGACATSLAGRDEDHVGALQRLLQLIAALLGCRPADDWVRAGTETARRLGANVDLDVGVAHQKRLRVGVHDDELDPGDVGIDHAVDRVRAPAADTDDFDHREITVVGLVFHLVRLGSG